ncbi:hypothetical protein C3747_114g72 [Trypanosoma cruzi]|uniref:Cullin neddylation domain-containing protein n=2 Tax=Trypanosoma cruzi TaxID=5693 RepID=Q4CX65_TRYCC|nr:hypothetical protein, conserved [Trypanosoma cruzi]EAN84868.1 hypothetical protein, conserved [Trypanosoma cruzi]PWV06515.1 hypothetical protein C3747_114g72 [Trypanosoma cruzi]RNC43252.1 hypothetical protein TcCL_NonESM07099 [Trypanosoma cruzi]|eukprot:XP_806719.1 hypothetical protein [Trypanosoma cruzi strain CL Brener]
MSGEVKELVHWLRKWDPINRSLLHFANHTHALYPFEISCKILRAVSSSSVSLVGGHEDSEALPQPKETKGGMVVAGSVEEEASAAFTEAADSSNISVLYARVYDMLSTFGKVEFWSNAVIFQHLLVSSLLAWVARLCASSGDRLHACPAISIEELTPQLLWWKSHELRDVWEEAVRNNSRPWTELAGLMSTEPETDRKRSRERSLVTVTSCASSLELRPHKDGEGECNSGARPHGEEERKKKEEEVEDILDLHTLVTFALHYCRMRWILKVVFLRVDVEMNDIAWRIMRSCVHATLEQNSTMIRRVLCRTVEYCVKGSQSPDGFKAVELTQVEGQECLNDLSSSSVSLDALRRLRDRDISLVCRVFSMLDECCVHDISRFATDGVVQFNQQHGYELACRNFGPLLVSNGKDKNEVPALQDAFVALQNCNNAFMRLRAAMLLYFGGTTHYVDELSGPGRERVAQAERAFSVGFCQGVVLLQFVDVWALPLWLCACEEEHERRLFSASRHARWRSVDDMSEGRDSSIVFRSFSEAVSQLGEVENIKNKYSLHISSLPLRPGLETLIFFLSPEPKLLSEFETRFAASVRRYLEELLQKSHTTGTPLRALPRDVYQRCVFLLRLTNQLLEASAAAGCEGAHATLRAVRRGMQTFFVEREPCVILTLASALHAQVTGRNSHGGPNGDDDNDVRGYGGAYLEILDTILELASLLHSKDLFVNCYCGLLATRLMMAQHALTLDIETEAISRMAIRLGDSLAAEPFALLRDVRASMTDPRCIIPDTGGVQQSELLRHVRVLCRIRWEKYALVTVRLSEVQRCFEEEEWFDAGMLHAMQSFEKRFDTTEGSASGNKLRLNASLLGSRDARFFGGRGSLGNDDEEESHVISRNDHVLTAAGGGGGAGGDRSAGFSRSSPPGPVSLPAVGGAVQRRRLSWSLGSGVLTVVCHAARGSTGDAASSVQLVMPPVGLLLLQALERYGDSSTTASLSGPTRCTLDFLHGKLPVDVPKTLLAAVLGGLVRHRIVRRTVHASSHSNDGGDGDGGGFSTYGLPASFEGCKKRKVVIDVENAMHHWVPYLQEGPDDSKAIVMTVDGIIDTERLRKLEAGIVRIMKEKRSLSHFDLFASVAELLMTHFVVTAPVFKRCMARLIEREFIARSERDTYVYVA